MDVLKERSTRTNGLLAAPALFLLTDGVPNVDPPRGIIPTFNRYKDSCGGRLPSVINTFGFGYSLESPLLSALSCGGDGAYAFIPDAGMVGTAFINALANLLCSRGSNAVLQLEPADGPAGQGVQLLGLAGTVQPAMNGASLHSWGLQVDLGTLHSGQTKDVLVRLALPPGRDARDVCGALRVTLKYEDIKTGQGRTIVLEPPAAAGGHSTTPSISALLVAEHARCRALLSTAVDMACPTGSSKKLHEWHEALPKVTP